MKKLNILKITAYGFVLAMFAVSCIPETDVTPAGTKGKTVVKITPAEFNLVAIDAVPISQTAVLFEVRKDANSASALKTATTVTLRLDLDQAMIDTFNVRNETSFELMPASLYSLNYTPAVDGTITLNFAPGDHTKTLWITVPNAMDFDFAKSYMVAFKVTVSGEGTWTGAAIDTMYCQVLAKNKYDGLYEITENSPMVDVLNAGLTGWYPFTYELQTTGEHTVACYLVDPGYYNYYHPITNAGAVSVYGAFGLELEFNHAGTGEIIAVYNPWGNPPANTRMPVIDPSGVNAWDPATGNIQFKYWMKQPSLVPDPPNIRVSFDEIWTRKGPR